MILNQQFSPQPDSIRLRDFDICGARHIFHKSDAERLNQTTVLYQAENTGELAGDFIQSPVYMVSGMVKKILDMYEDDLVLTKKKEQRFYTIRC